MAESHPTKIDTTPSAGRAALLFGLLLALLFAPPTHARTEKLSVSRLNTQMMKRFRQGDYRGALTIARRLYQRTHNPQLLVNIARCHDLLQQYGPAIAHYLKYAKTVSGPRQEQVVQRVLQLRLKFGLTHREIVIVTRPPAAAIWLDGKKLADPTPTTQWLPFGRHNLRFARSGYRTIQRVLMVIAGPTLTVDETLKPLLKPALLSVTSTRHGATVTLNGKRLGSAPLARQLLPAGRYVLRVVSRGYTVWTQQVTLRAGETTTIHAVLQPLPVTIVTTTPYRSAGWITLGVGLASLATGLALNLWSNKIVRDANTALDLKIAGASVFQSDIEAYNGDIARARSRATAAFVLYGIGGAAVAVSLVLILLKRRTRRTADTGLFQWHVQIAPNAAGFNARLRF